MLNSAHIVLLPKNAASKKISDYRPISLTSSIAKLISKLLANRLSKFLSQLVSRNQRAFIQKRSIHDKFLYTQNSIRDLHRAHKPALFLKLDIAKAFDSIRWDYLLELLAQMGFGRRWREWITILLSTATSSVLVNGSRTQSFRHKAGLRQGDPLSPMLFILALEPLQRILALAEQSGLLTPVTRRGANIRVSLYADDAAVFVNPVKEEIDTIKHIFDSFGRATGLKINLSKSAAYPICCEQLQIENIMQSMPCQIANLPCKYLGLPLSLRKLKRNDVQPMIDKVASKLPSWKGNLLDKAGRLSLVRQVLSSIPTYFLTVFPIKKWAIKKIDKLRRNFLWKGSDNANGGHCLVSWKKVMLPKKMCGLGIIDIELFSRALRLRWLWYEWREPDHPWVGTDVPCDAIDLQLFRVSTCVTVGDGTTASFWQSSWINGKVPMDIAPNLFKLA